MLANKYGVDISEKEVFGFLFPYLENEMSEFLIVLSYIDENNWDGEVSNWKDKVIHQMVLTLDSDQRDDIFRYIEDNENV